MKRLTTMLGASLAAFAASAGVAFAAGPVQSTTQSADTGQAAIAASSATQVQPSNQNISVRVLSPGGSGAVNQSNTASSSATAANGASTNQGALQLQGGGCGCGSSPVQSIAQAAEAGQLSGVLSGAAQLAPANSAAPSSVASPTKGGSTDQSNDAASSGTAANAAPTTQSSGQAQSGDGTQASQQSASTDQTAGAASSAVQDHPSNSNISVRVLSPGNDGNVSQSNDASSAANAANLAGTSQTAGQGQGGGGVQSATQSAGTQQDAVALSSAAQDHPSNSNISVRVLSPGNDGNVSQSNDVWSSADATNLSGTAQKAGQVQTGPSCGCADGGPQVQALGQDSSTLQLAGAASEADQIGASNANDPVRVWSPGSNGSVTQSNSDTSTAAAANAAGTFQGGLQLQSDPKCGCSSGPGVQALGQSSGTAQFAGAVSSALQVGASNQSDPVRIWSHGNDGSTSQSNDASSSATAVNLAGTAQGALQLQSGSGIQAIGQDAGTLQAAGALSFAAQLPGRESCGCGGGTFGNSADPVRVSSPGSGGSVDQSNDVSSDATAWNGAGTSQWAGQAQAADCGCGGLGVQAVGQQAFTGQLSKALSSAWQIGASNSFAPALVWSPGSLGSASQANGAGSTAAAPNGARSRENATQLQI
jgi:hypothetical protein